MPAAAPLATAFAALQQTRAATWTAPALAANAAQRQALRDAFDPAGVVQVGDIVPDTRLIDTAGDEIGLDVLVANGPAVLIFFRYAECPADNLALPIYDAALFDALAAAGVPLVAISPQRPERLAAIREQHRLRLTVASDPDNRLARSLGLLFTPLDTPVPPPPGWVGEITGTGTWELPQTSVLVIDTGRVARFVAVNPDWLDRVEPEAVLAALTHHPAERAAA